MDFLRYAILGLGTGAIYAMIAQGLVAIYRGSGIINFAQGGFVMVGGYMYYQLNHDWHLNFWPAMGLSVLVTAALGALVHLLVFRPMKRASVVARVLTTFGLTAVLEYGVALHYGQYPLYVKSYLPTRSIGLFSNVRIGADVLIILGVGAVLTLVLWAVYRFASFGRLTAAVAENQRATASVGRSPDRIAVYNWAIGAGLAGLGGVLFAPIIFLEPAPFTLLVVPALAAAMVGGFRSFPLAFVAALVVGAAESLFTRYTGTSGWSYSAAFLAIILVVLIRGRTIPLRSFVLDRLPAVGNGKVQPIPMAVGYIILMLAVGRFLPSEWVLPAALTIVGGIFCLSVGFLTGYSGQLSLAQYVIGGLSGLVAAELSGGVLHWSFLPALVVGVLAAVAAGGVTGAMAFRTRGITLAIVTLGLSETLYSVILNSKRFAAGSGGIQVDPPTLLGWSINPLTYPERYSMVCVTGLFLVMLAVMNIRRGRTGRKLLAVRGNERAAAATGIDVRVVKLYAFSMAGAIAGCAGVLYAFTTPALLASQFDVLSSINLVTVTVVGGIGYIGGGLIGATMLPNGVVSQIFANYPTVNEWLPFIGGLSVILVLRVNQNGVFAANRDMAKALYRRFRRERREDGRQRRGVTLDVATDSPGFARVVPTSLRVEGLRVNFSGVIAVANVSLEVLPGEIHGLIGPNGAGKTALIDAVTGFVRPSDGRVVLGDEQVTGWRPERLARAGLARSFQSVELFDGLTAGENLAVGCEGGSGWLSYFRDIVAPGRLRLSPAAVAAVRRFGIEDELNRTVESLPFGRRRLIAVARAVASMPSVLLLDEPAAGLDEQETNELVDVITWLAREWGMAVLLVEHDLEMVLRTCDRVTVMASGAELFSGSPEDVRTDVAVLEAYIGTDEAKPAADGRARAFAAMRVGEVEASAGVEAGNLGSSLGAAPGTRAQGAPSEPSRNGQVQLPPPSTGRERAAGDPLLEIEDLIGGYGDLPAVRGLSLQLYPGEIVALLGPNGAGKTTTLLTLAGELPPLGGSIKYKGQELRGPLHRRAQQGIGLVPEERSVLMGLSVLDNLKIGGDPDPALSLFPELQSLLFSRAGLLSGGQQQMLSLGRILAQRPAVLLLDELSLGLAPLVVNRLLSALQDVARQEGTAVLLVEQQAHRALDIADRWCLLRRGVMTAAGDSAHAADLWAAYVE